MPAQSESTLAPRQGAADLIPHEAADVSIGGILRHAVDTGMPPESLEKLLAVWERVEDRNAAKEFAAAMAAFQAECPPIPKTATAKIVKKSGGSYSFKFAPLEAMAQFIRPYLEKHGLSYTWDSSEEANKITCTCTARHINGHSVSGSFTCSNATAAAMSEAQKSGAALTYARRQSLLQVFGLVTADPDDTDGGGADPITEQQAHSLRMMISEVGADEAKFLEYMDVGSIAEISAADYSTAVSALEAKRRKSGGLK